MTDAVVEPSPVEDNDDSWLYGDGPGELRDGKASADGEKTVPNTGHDADNLQDGKEKDHEDNENEAEENDDSHFNDEHFAEVGRERDEHEKNNGDAASGSAGHGDSDSDDSDDVKVTIGDIKAGPPAYASLNIKQRGVGLVAAGAGEKPRSGAAPAPGKVTLEDLDGPGSINGVPALEFNIDTIEDKPWNKPGADISDYFNYGFNEVTWSAYCERQRRMRVTEAGVALLAGPPTRPPPPDAHLRRMPGPPRNDEGMHSPMANNYQARENTIQVMTAERREYGRAAREPAPPDYFGAPPDHYFPPHAPYDEPWGHPEQSGWAPSDIKELTPGPMGPPNMGPPPGMGPPSHLSPGAPHLMPAPPFAAPYRPHPPHPSHPLDRARDDRDRRDRDRDRRDDEERDRDRERSRSIKPERLREKSYRRERSRSRSRRHKSRSRSPRLRERSRERERERERSRDRERDRDRSRDRERSLKPKSKEAKEKEDDK